MRTALVVVACAVFSAEALACSDGAPPPAMMDASAVVDAPIEDTAPPPVNLADYFYLDVAMFQSTKINLTKGGLPWSENATVAGGKAGILRVYLSPAGGPLYQSAIACELELQYPDKTTKKLTDNHVLSKVSKDSDIKSTFVFKLSAAEVVPDMTFTVRIYDSMKPGVEMKYPPDGIPDSLRVKGYVSDFRIQLVPVHYTADNFDLLPDVSSTQIDYYKRTLLQMYPLANVTFLTPRAPIEWPTKVWASGMGWDALLMAIAQTRANDNPPADVYYMGAFRPMPVFGTYCANGCILGLSPVPQANDVAGRASLIIGYSGMSADTLNHELGHALGRLHAPCGAPKSIDPQFPYGNGSIGVWGWDFTNDTWVDPSMHYDFMSYCGPPWVADYTYKFLYQRISYVRQNAGFSKQVDMPQTMQRILSVGSDGSARWLTPAMQPGLPGERTLAHFIDARGADLGEITAGKWSLPDIDRNVFFLPDVPSGATRLRIAGRDVVLP